jgi:hypothetical protein
MTKQTEKGGNIHEVDVQISFRILRNYMKHEEEQAQCRRRLKSSYSTNLP